MRIIHMADVHLDSKLNARLDNENAKKRRAEILDTFRKCISYAKSNGVQAILIAGDLFDTNKVNKGTRDSVETIIRNNGELDFYYLKGNHDASSFLNGLVDIPANLHLFSDEWTCYHLSEKVVLSGVEFNGLNTNSIYHSLNLNLHDLNIVMLHGQESVSAGKDKTEIINITDLKNRGIDYLALGHIHSFKYERLDNRGMYCYPGCLEGRGFDETGEHGFCVLDIDEETRKINMSFIECAYRHLYEIEVCANEANSTEDLISRTANALNSSKATSSDFIRVVLSGELDVNVEIQEESIEAHYKDQYFYFEVKNETKRKVDYEKYALDESLKGEFVRLLKNDESLSEEEKAAIIRYGLEALSSGEINL